MATSRQWVRMLTIDTEGNGNGRFKGDWVVPAAGDATVQLRDPDGTRVLLGIDADGRATGVLSRTDDGRESLRTV